MQVHADGKSARTDIRIEERVKLRLMIQNKTRGYSHVNI